MFLYLPTSLYLYRKFYFDNGILHQCGPTYKTDWTGFEEDQLIYI